MNRSIGALAIGVALLAACRSPKPAVVPPPEPSQNLSLSAHVSAKLLPDPSAPALELGPGEEYVQPQIQPGNPIPAYPVDLVSRRLPPHVVAVRMVIDEQGCVSGIAPSPIAATTTDEYSTRFEESVRKALALWYVSPPQIRKFKPGADLDGDGKPDYRVLVDSRTLKAFFDVSFIFEIVDGRPIVRSDRH